MGQNDSVSTPTNPEPHIKESGLGWPINVSRETFQEELEPDTGLGWPE